eukprot:jgi/Orpsp1_1/1178191/evm.model.c7180000064373.1
METLYIMMKVIYVIETHLRDWEATSGFVPYDKIGVGDDEFFSHPEWGYDGTGHFYLSYYDKKIYEPTSFDFSIVEIAEKEEGAIYVIDQHDLLPTREGWHILESDNEVVMSN